jgi:glycolate oxidase iron-sulfur subunit
MLAMLPDHLPPSQPLPALYPAEGQRRARVALLAGCVQQVLAPEINWATLHVLAKNGVETVIPAGQGCCGALPMHQGEEKQGRELALRNLRVFPKDVDAVVTNAAGCGSGIREYGLLFRGDPAQNEAEAFAKQVKDVSVFLAELGAESAASASTPQAGLSRCLSPVERTGHHRTSTPVAQEHFKLDAARSAGRRHVLRLGGRL